MSRRRPERALLMLAVAVAILVVLLVRGHHRGSSGASPAAAPPVAAVPAATAVRAAAASIRNVMVDGIDVTIARPRHPNGRAVLYMHGTEETATEDLTAPLSAPLLAALLRAGYAWAEPGTSALNWGDPTSVAQDLAAAGYLQASGQRIVVMAASMGGLDALQILPKVDPGAFIGLYPVCNLSTLGPSSAASIAASGAAVADLSPVPITAPAGLSMLLLASPEDTVVPKVENADVCAAEARRAGMDVTEITTTGEHGDPSNWRPGPILAFLRRSLDR